MRKRELVALISELSGEPKYKLETTLKYVWEAVRIALMEKEEEIYIPQLGYLYLHRPDPFIRRSAHFEGVEETIYPKPKIKFRHTDPITRKIKYEHLEGLYESGKKKRKKK